jgi:hypothetical protein
MTDEYPRHAPPEVLDTLQELISKNSPGEIGTLIYTALCQTFKKQDDKRKDYLNELAEFFRLLATNENAHLHHNKSRPTVLLNPSTPPEV